MCLGIRDTCPQTPTLIMTNAITLSKFCKFPNLISFILNRKTQWWSESSVRSVQPGACNMVSIQQTAEFIFAFVNNSREQLYCTLYCTDYVPGTIYIYTHTHTHNYIYRYMNVHLYVYLYMYVIICKIIYNCKYIHTYICMTVYACMCLLHLLILTTRVSIL